MFQGAWTKNNQNKNLRHSLSIFCEASVLSLPFAPGSDYPLHPNMSPQQKGRGCVQEEQPGQQRIASWHYHWVLIMTALITDARKKWGIRWIRDIHHIWNAHPTQWSEFTTLSIADVLNSWMCKQHLNIFDRLDYPFGCGQNSWVLCHSLPRILESIQPLNIQIRTTELSMEWSVNFLIDWAEKPERCAIGLLRGTLQELLGWRSVQHWQMKSHSI